ncbi:UDP-N-acetylmuramate dehydrogenase [Anaerotalea alkaliphila]|uniref:UDP-N-acetylenolpyruvoylglucosamine reductase n=1 Tax=Anaerotalea alkaliphila TaxID=2662126 RepID=A0A7X5HV36_9FIRM|nr:UDP-N-acetylmuramate dehydrogenase [Anaerotalea alkaliphila]NDL67191.1 UDP-N-acetylmuramate dehydrogenase [Anaerotalea alkaliphila]
MEKKEIGGLLGGILPEDRILRDEPMANHTSFRIGGPADFYVAPQTVEELQAVLALCHGKGIPLQVLGNGSNLLVRDGGIRGIVVEVYRNFSGIRFLEGGKVKAQAGILLSKLAGAVWKEGLGGFEFASGIPGTLGGAVFMNAGAYGGEMKDILLEVQALEMDGTLTTFPAEALELEYRHSVFHHRPAVVLEATLQLVPGDRQAIKERMRELNAQRKMKQPLELPSAGSTFKRPEGYFAGKLIMDAGLRGVSIGGAQVSEKHCGFVVNKGQASCQEVQDLIAHIQDTVFQQYGVRLEPEVKIIGEP